MKKMIVMFFLVLVLFTGTALAYDENEYIIKRAPSPLTIDGVLDEPAWEAAARTESFLVYTDESTPEAATYGKMLWDDTYLYVAFVCEDPDVFGHLDERDSHIWDEGECVEIFIDPDSDQKDFLEFEFNALATILDLQDYKAYDTNFDWNMIDIKAATTIDGTINDNSDTDNGWTCEIALSFEEMGFCAPTKNFPPQDGDVWRIDLFRYQTNQSDLTKHELTAWNPTITGGFHNAAKYGYGIFSTEPVITTTGMNTDALPDNFGIVSNAPNPFNPTTTISFATPEAGDVTLDIYNSLGQHVTDLIDGHVDAGQHTTSWSARDAGGSNVSTGLYIARLVMGDRVSCHNLMYIR